MSPIIQNSSGRPRWRCSEVSMGNLLWVFQTHWQFSSWRNWWGNFFYFHIPCKYQKIDFSSRLTSVLSTWTGGYIILVYHQYPIIWSCNLNTKLPTLPSFFLCSCPESLWLAIVPWPPLRKKSSAKRTNLSLLISTSHQKVSKTAIINLYECKEGHFWFL